MGNKWSYKAKYVAAQREMPPLNVELILKDVSVCDQYFTSMVDRVKRVVLIEEYPDGILGLVQVGNGSYKEFFRKKDFSSGVIIFSRVQEVN